METIRLNFVPPQFVVKCFPVERKLGPVALDVPEGSQFLNVDAPAYDPQKIHFWIATPTNRRPMTKATFLVVEEGQPFDAQECHDKVILPDGSLYEDHHVHFYSVGFWAEPIVDAEGSGRYRTIHVLEVDLDEHEAEGDGDDGVEVTPELPPKE